MTAFVQNMYSKITLTGAR